MLQCAFSLYHPSSARRRRGLCQQSLGIQFLFHFLTWRSFSLSCIRGFSSAWSLHASMYFLTVSGLSKFIWWSYREIFSWFSGRKYSRQEKEPDSYTYESLFVERNFSWVYHTISWGKERETIFHLLPS